MTHVFDLRQAGCSIAIVLLCGLTIGGEAYAQVDAWPSRDSLYISYEAFKDSLTEAVASEDTRQLDVLWERLIQAHQVPYVQGNSVAFLYRGDAASVAWNGDFNQWSRDQSFANQGTRLGNSDLWILEQSFPADARLDYKIVVDDQQWMLDPNNPIQQWSGFGPNSVLAMPDYVFPAETIAREGGSQGTLGEEKRIQSEHLGYEVQYRVYTPASYDALSSLPTLYVTDGHEYAADQLGSLQTVVDNLIADQRIQPIIVVFVDPREPGNPNNNRRGSEYALNKKVFADFLAEELVPAIDAAYKSNPSPESRGILGTSLGGIFSTYVGAAKPDVFRRIAIHSPAYFFDIQNGGDLVYEMYAAADRLPLKMFMSVGTVHDGQQEALRMKALLDDKGYDLHYVEVNEGHSWGNWRALVDEPLLYFWGE